MKYYAMSLDEMAEELGTTEPAVRAEIRRALAKVRLKNPEYASWLTGENYAMVAGNRRRDQAYSNAASFCRSDGKRQER